jgi:hypothetical protein
MARQKARLEHKLLIFLKTDSSYYARVCRRKIPVDERRAIAADRGRDFSPWPASGCENLSLLRLGARFSNFRNHDRAVAWPAERPDGDLSSYVAPRSTIHTERRHHVRLGCGGGGHAGWARRVRVRDRVRQVQDYRIRGRIRSITGVPLCVSCARKQTKRPARHAPPVKPSRENVVSLMDALRRSIAEGRPAKPAPRRGVDKRAGPQRAARARRAS